MRSGGGNSNIFWENHPFSLGVSWSNFTHICFRWVAWNHQLFGSFEGFPPGCAWYDLTASPDNAASCHSSTNKSLEEHQQTLEVGVILKFAIEKKIQISWLKWTFDSTFELILPIPKNTKQHVTCSPLKGTFFHVKKVSFDDRHFAMFFFGKIYVTILTIFFSVRTLVQMVMKITSESLEWWNTNVWWCCRSPLEWF